MSLEIATNILLYITIILTILIVISHILKNAFFKKITKKEWFGWIYYIQAFLWILIVFLVFIFGQTTQNQSSYGGKATLFWIGVISALVWLFVGIASFKSAEIAKKKERLKNLQR